MKLIHNQEPRTLNGKRKASSTKRMPLKKELLTTLFSHLKKKKLDLTLIKYTEENRQDTSINTGFSGVLWFCSIGKGNKK